MTAKKVDTKKAETKKVVAPVKAVAKPVEKAPVVKAEPKKAEPKKAPVVKKEAAEIPQEVPEIPKKEIMPVPDACDAVADGFKTKGKVGFFDGASDDCKQCGEDYPEAMAACKNNTEVEAIKVKVKKVKATGTKRSTEKTPLGSTLDSATGRMELLMLRKEGATKEEMTALRGAISSHLNSLKKRGHIITHKDGRYFAQIA